MNMSIEEAITFAHSKFGVNYHDKKMLNVLSKTAQAWLKLTKTIDRHDRMVDVSKPCPKEPYAAGLWCAYRDMFLKAQALFPTPPPKSKWDRIREAIEIQGSTNWTTMGEMVKENLLEFIDHLEKEEKDQK